MYLALNAWTFPAETPPGEQLTLAANAGFAAIELTADPAGALRPDSPIEDFQSVAALARDRDIEIIGLASAEYWDVNFGHDDAAIRTRAHTLTRALLERTAALGGGSLLLVPAVIGKASEPVGRTRYEDALAWSLEGLSKISRDAEALGVTIVIENAWNRFLYSPVEFAELIDRVNSPRIAACFDVGNVLLYGYPEDWIATLGGRIARVHVKDFDVSKPGWTGFCPLGEGSVNWPGVISALERIGYAGPLTFEGRGDLADIFARLRRIAPQARIRPAAEALG